MGSEQGTAVSLALCELSGPHTSSWPNSLPSPQEESWGGLKASIESESIPRTGMLSPLFPGVIVLHCKLNLFVFSADF